MSENLKYGYDVNDLGLVRNLDAFYKLVSRELSETGDITFELDNSRDIYSTEEVFTKLVEGGNVVLVKNSEKNFENYRY